MLAVGLIRDLPPGRSDGGLQQVFNEALERRTIHSSPQTEAVAMASTTSMTVFPQAKPGVDMDKRTASGDRAETSAVGLRAGRAGKRGNDFGNALFPTEWNPVGNSKWRVCSSEFGSGLFETAGTKTLCYYVAVSEKVDG